MSPYPLARRGDTPLTASSRPYVELGVYAPNFDVKLTVEQDMEKLREAEIRAFVEIDGERREAPIDRENADHLTALDHWWAAQGATPGSDLRFRHHYAFIILLFDDDTITTIGPADVLPEIRDAIDAARYLHDHELDYKPDLPALPPGPADDRSQR